MPALDSVVRLRCHDLLPMTPIRVELLFGPLDGLVMHVSGPVLRIPRDRKVSIAHGPSASYEYVTIPCVVYKGFTYNRRRKPPVRMVFAGWE